MKFSVELAAAVTPKEPDITTDPHGMGVKLALHLLSHYLTHCRLNHLQPTKVGWFFTEQSTITQQFQTGGYALPGENETLFTVRIGCSVMGNLEAAAKDPEFEHNMPDIRWYLASQQAKAERKGKKSEEGGKDAHFEGPVVGGPPTASQLTEVLGIPPDTAAELVAIRAAQVPTIE